ncbi:class I SAM-dependent methyltransferase [Variovorax sp. RT4R15]|uniref:class I SAM-dependent methyltransferase n=1 Tax=Variovorax sp. RT4R15 TaxID=3443737 RepID=UPI003F487AEB
MNRVARTLNTLLSGIDVALTRRTTLDRTRAQLALAQTRLEEARAVLSTRFEKLDVAENPASSRETTGEAACSNAVALVNQEVQGIHRELLRHQIAAKWNVLDAMNRSIGSKSDLRTCALCRHTAAVADFKIFTSHCIFGGGVLSRYQCPACDVIFGPDKMFVLSLAELGQEYEWHYKVYEEGDSTEAELRAFHSLNPRRDGQYVNYGAGTWSRSVQLLRADGWNVLAYEPHSSAATGAEWVISSRQEMDKLRFDGLFSNNVLEHLRNPVDDLKSMARWLAPGAKMAHATPCYQYLYEFTRFHLFFFTGRSRELLAQMAGLSIKHYEVDGHYMNCVFLPQPEALC